MTLLRVTANRLLEEYTSQSLVESLLERMLFERGVTVAEAEQRSWSNSLPKLAADLRQGGLGGVEMLIEYKLPLSSRRADVVLAGIHPHTGEPSYVVVELKQWSSATAFEGDIRMVSVPHLGGPVLHPVAQVAGYCQYIGDFARSLRDQEDPLAGVAYLHNVTQRGAIEDLIDFPVTNAGRMFTGAETDRLLDFLRTRLAPDAHPGPAADALLNSPAAPSQQLLAVAAEEVRERQVFHLLGNQKLAVDLVLHDVERARAADTKRVIVVTGGPGSGKSAIALALLGDLARQGRTVLHATGSRSFTTTLRQVAGERAPRVKAMFKYFNQFVAAERNGLDVLILDEAHRIRETSANRFTKAMNRTGRPQVDELIAAARVPLFLLDEHQVVRPGELGSLPQIRAYAASLGLETIHIHLDDQFRCGGSERYVEWVLDLVGLSEKKAWTWTGDEGFDVRVAETPWDLERMLDDKRAEGYSARMTAGYCWSWSDPTPEKTLVPDVEIGDWARPWNSKSDRRIGDAPPSQLWATDDGGFGQVGCVYTAQGFEYDYSGVILGPDFVWRDGRFVVQRDQNKDPSLKSKKGLSDPRFDLLIRNTYKVLLTRGMSGTVLYSTDEETREALTRFVQPM
ncbi:AAA+ ATPase domain-containing protein OS=Tsukamurella paurometabola (strain ATCC 8368 / DSM/ CCUG 35730 / CIP 100753 / JCM 10117 / KCTC 9821 / NBRC 16120/ NCIMB 702349 / NCTC 13040) OX=521096 GN=Tpau_2554 PE=4 SV=1 [Tsukamurella paurometabola]|uniref:AAA+ ATPase domain-containing protein n=1 Tax=Tsukamurella paurometabola (strain ATCC 8368 / DSM 20162 / CCUG 35730 / CIP 100753 / JCM 10117 / KCTC 9821 / NBRC 16120 / NCIMB 702349 / NCTC 13040) TaxID=521096 RepID=D5URV2_TSUPD|nr:DUF2075 domain-containing protein [Tsukamurella paurometabola]ADG79157.1 Protein of unknown function DUF2075 [Tsukamurella paurometabola DSM 20162]SUP34323.1 Uncharacterized conserved protein [Tsukamurella paurometabola]